MHSFTMVALPFPVRLGKILFGPAGGWLWVSCCVSWNPIHDWMLSIESSEVSHVDGSDPVNPRFQPENSSLPMMDGLAGWMFKHQWKLYMILLGWSHPKCPCVSEKIHISPPVWDWIFFWRWFSERIGGRCSYLINHDIVQDWCEVFYWFFKTCIALVWILFIACSWWKITENHPWHQDNSSHFLYQDLLPKVCINFRTGDPWNP